MGSDSLSGPVFKGKEPNYTSDMYMWAWSFKGL